MGNWGLPFEINFSACWRPSHIFYIKLFVLKNKSGTLVVYSWEFLFCMAMLYVKKNIVSYLYLNNIYLIVYLKVVSVFFWRRKIKCSLEEDLSIFERIKIQMFFGKRNYRFEVLNKLWERRINKPRKLTKQDSYTQFN